MCDPVILPWPIPPLLTRTASHVSFVPQGHSEHPPSPLTSLQLLHFGALSSACPWPSQPLVIFFFPIYGHPGPTHARLNIISSLSLSTPLLSMVSSGKAPWTRNAPDYHWTPQVPSSAPQRIHSRFHPYPPLPKSDLRLRELQQGGHPARSHHPSSSGHRHLCKSKPSTNFIYAGLECGGQGLCHLSLTLLVQILPCFKYHTWRFHIFEP